MGGIHTVQTSLFCLSTSVSLWFGLEGYGFLDVRSVKGDMDSASFISILRAQHLAEPTLWLGIHGKGP